MRKYNEEMDKMQQEAVRRMQEMQSRGKPANVQHTASHSVNAEQNQNQEPHHKPVPVHNEDCCESDTQIKQPSFFESIFHDKERSLILLLLLLLSTEKTDTGLILALVYLLI